MALERGERESGALLKGRLLCTGCEAAAAADRPLVRGARPTLGDNWMERTSARSLMCLRMFQFLSWLR